MAAQKDFGAEDEVDLKDVFYMFANAEQEGVEAVMDRKKITRALKALGIGDEMNAETVLQSMDADGNGVIDIEEWTTCMTPELRRHIYAKMNNKEKLAGFKPLVDVARVFDQFDSDKSGSLSVDEIKSAMVCLLGNAWDLDQLFENMDVDKDGEVSLEEFKYYLERNKFIYQAMAKKMSDQGLIEGL
jgi:Ca2+-binding EF-hand superfamily protein